MYIFPTQYFWSIRYWFMPTLILRWTIVLAFLGLRSVMGYFVEGTICVHSYWSLFSYKKNLKQLYIIEPTFLIRSIVKLFQVFDLLVLTANNLVSPSSVQSFGRSWCISIGKLPATCFLKPPLDYKIFTSIWALSNSSSPKTLKICYPLKLTKDCQ